MYRPMKKCVSPVRMAPMAMRKHPMAMSLGRCSLAPKWLTTARNSRLPKSKKSGVKQKKAKKKMFTINERIDGVAEMKWMTVRWA